MSEHSSIRTASWPDFNLPEEILSVIPTDPSDLLDLGRKITLMALTLLVSELESEAGRLRHKLNEQDRVISELEDKLSELQQTCHNTLEDNMKLTEERDSLVTTNKNLRLELAKTFKRQLMQSLNDNDSTASNVDIGTSDRSAPIAYPDTASKLAGQTFTPKPYTWAISSWYSSSQQSSAENSSPSGPSIPGRVAMINCKEIYRQARSRLTYDQYCAFMTNIIELNARKQSLEEMLRKAEAEPAHRACNMSNRPGPTSMRGPFVYVKCVYILSYLLSSRVKKEWMTIRFTHRIAVLDFTHKKEKVIDNICTLNNWYLVVRIWYL